MTDVMEQTGFRVSSAADVRPDMTADASVKPATPDGPYTDVRMTDQRTNDGRTADGRTTDGRVGQTPDGMMTIREMCDAFDVTPRTLRFYESKELLFPVREGTRRLFTRRDRARLTLILRGKRFGFSLEEIRQLLDMHDMGDQGGAQLARTYALAARHLAEMEAQRDELVQAITELKSQMEWGVAEMARLGIQQPTA